MHDREQLTELLSQIHDALGRIARRIDGIESPADFRASPEGEDRLDGICMMLIAVGEGFKRIDRITNGSLLARYPEIDWTGVKGVRDVIAHTYFDVDDEEVFEISREDIPQLIRTVEKMLQSLE